MTEYATGKGSYVHYRKPSGHTGKIYAWGKSGRDATKKHISGKGWSYTHTTYVTVSGREARKAPAPSQKPTPIKEEVAPPGEEEVYPYYPKESRYGAYKTSHTKRYLPKETFTPVKLIARSKAQELHARYQWMKEKESIDPLTKYEIPVEEQKGVHRIIIGQELLSEKGTTYRGYLKEQRGFRKGISALDPRAKLVEIDGGYKVLPSPTTTSLTTSEFEKKSWGEQKAIEFFAPIVQLPTTVLDVLGLTEKGKEWVHPTTGRHYIKQTLTVAYRPVDTYYDPYTGKRFTLSGSELTEIKDPLLGFAEQTHKIPTLLDIPLSKIPGATDITKERATWVERRIQTDPTSLITMGAGEYATLWGTGQVLKPIGRAVAYLGGRIGGSPIVVKPVIKAVTGVRTGLGRGIKYMPGTVKQITSGLFGKVQPGSFRVGRLGISTMIDPTTRYTSVVGGGRLRLVGGYVSRFMYQSPKSSYFVTGGYAQPLYGASVISSRGLFKGIRAGREPTRGWGMFKGFRVEKFTTMKKYYPWSKGGNIYQPGQWMSTKHISSLQKMGTSVIDADISISGRGFGLIGTKTTIGKPYGLPKKVDITQVGFGMKYRSIDKYMPYIMKSLKPVDYSFFGMGKITKPVISRGGVTITKQLTPATWKGVSGTQMLRFESPKMVSKGYLDYLDWLEPSYRQTAMPSSTRFPGIIFQSTKTHGRIDVFSDLVGRRSPILGKVLIGKSKVAMGYKRDLDFYFKSDFSMYGQAPVKTTGSIPGWLTKQLSRDISTQKISQGTMQGTGYKQMQKQVTVPKVTTALYTGPKSKPYYALFPKPPKSLYGRGRGMGGLGVDIPSYRFREFDLPGMKEILKNLSGKTTGTRRKLKKRKRRK